MPKLRVFLVDDEALARDRLKGWLLKEKDIEIAGEYSNGIDAIAALRDTPPDALFIDMEMPGANGLQVVQSLPELERPAVVFVTAHDRYAVDAFGIQAIDYLLKPFDRDRLQVTLRRLHAHAEARHAGDLGKRLQTLLAETPASGDRKPERLTVKVDGRLVFVKPEEIIWVEAADNYVVLHSSEGRLMLRDTLTSIEGRLPPTLFTRISRSALVNLDQIKELQPTFHGDYTVLLRNGTRLPLSRSLRGQLSRFTGEQLG